MTSPDPRDPGRGLSAQGAEKLTLAGFAVLIGFGCVLRFWKLSEDGFWYDEMWTVVAASDRPFMEMYRGWILGDPHPPGYFLFYFVWLALVPDDELWARIPNAIAGVVTVAYLLFGTARVLSRDARIYAAALASFSYLYIFYAVNVKQYSATILFVTVATVLFLEIAKDRRLSRRTAIALAAATVCLAYLDHFAMAYSWILLGLLAITLRGNASSLRLLGRVAITLVLTYLPIAYFLYFTFQYSDNSRASDLGGLLSDLTPSLFFDDPAVVAGFLVAVGVGLATRAPSAGAELRAGQLRHVLTVLSVVAGCLLLVSLRQPIFVIRYFIVLFPATLIGFAMLAAAAFPISTGWRAVVPLLFFTRAAVVDFRPVDGMQRQEWDVSVDLVLASVQPEDDVYVLGANPERSMVDYLRVGDFDAVVYRQNLEFYEYYFRRRGADDVAARLRVVEPTVQAARELSARHRRTGGTVFVLAGHHIQFDEESLWTLEEAARSVETTWLYSTIVYEITF